MAASDGQPVREARVTLADADGQVVGITTTKNDGAYLFPHLGSGHYTLSGAGCAPVALDVAVEEDGVSSVRVELGHRGRASTDGRAANLQDATDGYPGGLTGRMAAGMLS